MNHQRESFRKRIELTMLSGVFDFLGFLSLLSFSYEARSNTTSSYKMGSSNSSLLGTCNCCSNCVQVRSSGTTFESN